MQKELIKKYSVALLLILLILTSCGRELITNPIENVTVNDFPNKIGNEWKYFYYDSLSSYSDTVTVKVIGDTTFNNARTAKIWEYKYNNTSEYRFVEIIDDTVRMFKYFETSWDNTKFVFPLEVGRSWSGDFMNDSSIVDNKSPVSVPAGNFLECYLIKETWGAFNDYGRIKTWFVPSVGIVKKHHLGWSFGTANNYWELLEYHLN